MLFTEITAAMMFVVIASITNIKIANVIELYANNDPIVYLVYIVSIIAMIITIVLILFLIKRVNFKELASYILIPSLLLVMHNYLHGIPNVNSTLSIILIIIVGIISILLVWLYYKQLRRLAKTRAQNKATQLLLTSQNKEMNEVNSYYSTIRKSDHDFNNHFNTINQLIQETSYKEAIDYIESIKQNELGGTSL